MLTHITINNFTLVEHLDMDIQHGMTAITGETGTGKSILLDALGMTLGERADGERVRYGCERADITATFSLDDLPQARQWLIDHDLSHADECLLRRVITREGRSRSFINAQPVTLQQIRALGELLIDIHSQHAHQSLLQKSTHHRLLDEFAGHQALTKDVALSFQQWQTIYRDFTTLRDNVDEIRARRELLSYQVEELNQLNLQQGELESMEAEQKQLANADGIIQHSMQLAAYCNDEEHGIEPQINRALRLLDDMQEKGKSLTNAEQLLSQALILAQEASTEVRHQIDSTDVNPERLHDISERLSACYDIARKNHIKPEELLVKHQEISQELESLGQGDEQLEQLKARAHEAETAFYTQAQQLSQQRCAAAHELTSTVNQQLALLAMGSAEFTITVETQEKTPGIYGLDSIEFLISTNPGHPPKALSKVASGGELSRISLAIQVATAQTSHVATLVFDEVDVGIGGATADTVGKLLAQLGKKSQVLCVTHLAQVASKAHQHWQVKKHTENNQTESTIEALSTTDKIEEIARMISGNELSQQSMAHAQLMLHQTH